MLTVYSQMDSAQPGFQPKPELTQKITLRYEERRLGIQRYYAAAQSQQRIERVVRVPKTGKVSAQDVVMTQDGGQYRIEMVQTVPDVFPASLDLTLSRIEQIAQVKR